ncbi:unnamed protein product, partial [Scytosiphon promiscuus]
EPARTVGAFLLLLLLLLLHDHGTENAWRRAGRAGKAIGETSPPARFRPLFSQRLFSDREVAPDAFVTRRSTPESCGSAAGSPFLSSGSSPFGLAILLGRKRGVGNGGVVRGEIARHGNAGITCGCRRRSREGIRHACARGRGGQRRPSHRVFGLRVRHGYVSRLESGDRHVGDYYGAGIEYRAAPSVSIGQVPCLWEVIFAWWNCFAPRVRCRWRSVAHSCCCCRFSFPGIVRVFARVGCLRRSVCP